MSVKFCCCQQFIKKLLPKKNAMNIKNIERFSALVEAREAGESWRH
jgi:hypothetical protein